MVDITKDNKRLFNEWNYDKNINFDIHNVKVKDKVWWICEKGHEYEATIDSRNYGTGCPYCCNKKILKGYNDLATTNPKLIKERDFEKNEKLGYSPYEISKGASIKAWWKCKKGHERQAVVYSRTVENANGCPYCSNQKVLEGYNDLKTTNPDIAKQWNFEKNGNITPSTISGGSNKKYRWRCEKGHEWQAVVSSRTRNNAGCPYCSNQRVLKGYNDLLTTNPELSKQWNYDKNGDLTPDKITGKSNKKVWWKCEKGHEWINSPNLRKNNGCPYCGNQKVLKGYNDLATTHPDLLKERDYEKNIINPYSVQAGSELKVRWRCNKGHSFKSRIDTRAKKNYGCPICSKGLHVSFPEKAILYYFLKVDKNTTENYKNESIGISELDIFIQDKRIGIEYDGNRWHSDREKDLLKNKVCENNHIKLYRIREYGCPILNSSSIDFYVNDGNYGELGNVINILMYDIYGVKLDVDINRDKTDIRKFMELNAKNSADHLPYEIVKQWDYEKNKGLEPSSFSIGTHKKVRWKCEKGHSYECSIANRSNGKGCPYCSSNKLLNGFNDLQTVNPKLATEWNYEKNGGMKPSEIMSKSGKKVRWKCKKGHEREAKVSNRSNGRGCPYCAGKLK